MHTGVRVQAGKHVFHRLFCIEVDKLMRCATLDVIGHAAFGYDFKALALLAARQGLGPTPAGGAGHGDDEALVDVVKVCAMRCAQCALRGVAVITATTVTHVTL
jgi:hypothetical protein